MSVRTGGQYEYREREGYLVGPDCRQAGRGLLHEEGTALYLLCKRRTITRSTFEKACEKIRENPEKVSGPKKLNVYGAPYVWAILSAVLGQEEM